LSNIKKKSENRAKATCKIQVQKLDLGETAPSVTPEATRPTIDIVSLTAGSQHEYRTGTTRAGVATVIYAGRPPLGNRTPQKKGKGKCPKGNRKAKRPAQRKR